jgi:cyclic pyranopterin phosphate synthase
MHIGDDARLEDSFGRHINYLRLSVTDRCDLRAHPFDDERVRAAIVEAVRLKPRGHGFVPGGRSSLPRHMNATGG